jgi:hypothetical protein
MTHRRSEWEINCAICGISVIAGTPKRRYCATCRSVVRLQNERKRREKERVLRGGRNVNWHDTNRGPLPEHFIIRRMYETCRGNEDCTTCFFQILPVFVDKCPKRFQGDLPPMFLLQAL